jgi:hypothetical protein
MESENDKEWKFFPHFMDEESEVDRINKLHKVA